MYYGINISERSKHLRSYSTLQNGDQNLSRQGRQTAFFHLCGGVSTVAICDVHRSNPPASQQLVCDRHVILGDVDPVEVSPSPQAARFCQIGRNGLLLPPRFRAATGRGRDRNRNGEGNSGASSNITPGGVRDTDVYQLTPLRRDTALL